MSVNIETLDYRNIIELMFPDSIFEINGNDYLSLIWSGNNTYPKPTEQEIINKNNEILNEIKYFELREKRNKLLQDSDKYSLVDFPHLNDTIRQKWLKYRQDLRNITNQIPSINLESGDISNINWPTPPS
jgi:hypothetical protein